MATTGALMAGLAFTATLFTAGPAPAQDEARTLVLHVDNYARIPSDVLALAEREAARVYEAAAIRSNAVPKGGLAAGCVCLGECRAAAELAQLSQLEGFKRRERRRIKGGRAKVFTTRRVGGVGRGCRRW